MLSLPSKIHLHQQQQKQLRRKAMDLIQQSQTLHHLFQAHAFLIKTSFDQNRFVIAKFFRRFLGKPSQQSLKYACALFELFRSPDAFLFNTIIRAYLAVDNPLECLSLFRRMLVSNCILPDSFSLSSALQACGQCRDRRTGEMIHVHVVKSGFVQDLFVQTALLEMYSKCGGTSNARRVFDEMPHKDLVLHNVMLAGFIASGDVKEASTLFSEICDKDIVSWNTMIHGYASIGDLVSAREVFYRMREKDLVSWSTMISAYVQSRDSNEALKLFHEMQMAGVVPDKLTMASVLSSFGDCGALNAGKAVHKMINKNQVEVDMRLGTSLVDMYFKCGDSESSLSVFRSMTEKDSLTWSTVIMGLANHGLGKLALDFFSDMLSEGVKPNDITFIGVLTACTHSGLLDEGRSHFRSMADLYGVKPKIEHYACMVDLLGKAGHVQEARKLIDEMPFDPDAVIWRALLGGCRIHKEVEIAEEAIVKLVELDPHADGHYVLLSNIYAQAGMWDKVSQVRRMIRGKNLQRIPGSSSIEIDNKVYEFLASDRSHTRSDEIYNMLSEMIDQIKQAGYMPMTSLVLQDIDELSKEDLLAQHSEKLAIAFGLMSSAPRSTIIIIKNLRVCEDCHSAIKLVSLVYDRQLVVRDRNRFHHFAKGECSCGDYW